MLTSPRRLAPMARDGRRRISCWRQLSVATGRSMMKPGSGSRNSHAQAHFCLSDHRCRLRVRASGSLSRSSVLSLERILPAGELGLWPLHPVAEAVLHNRGLCRPQNDANRSEPQDRFQDAFDLALSCTSDHLNSLLGATGLVVAVPV